VYDGIFIVRIVRDASEVLTYGHVSVLVLSDNYYAPIARVMKGNDALRTR